LPVAGGASGAPFFFSTSLAGESTAASTTFMLEFVGNLLRGRGEGSPFASIACDAPPRHPATSTRQKFETSSFARIGISTGTLTKSRQPTDASARPRLAAAATTILPVIDFSELIVVVANVGVVGIERHGFFVRLARFVELAELLVARAEIVPRRGVC